MQLKSLRCLNWKLYVITDKAGAEKRPLKETVRLAIEGGADVIQLRDKAASDRELARMAEELLTVTRPKRIPLIINDRISVAASVGADGVHLGQDDDSLDKARKILGPDAIVGRSTHSREQAIKAQTEGFDYIGVGPVFATPTKPSYEAVGLELVRFAAGSIRIPFVAIGGIDPSNAGQVKKMGAKTIAVVRAIMAGDSPDGAARLLKESMK
jgi:thiamine-phosphate pyrophosphorylase